MTTEKHAFVGMSLGAAARQTLQKELGDIATLADFSLDNIFGYLTFDPDVKRYLYHYGTGGDQKAESAVNFGNVIARELVPEPHIETFQAIPVDGATATVEERTNTILLRWLAGEDTVAAIRENEAEKTRLDIEKAKERAALDARYSRTLAPVKVESGTDTPEVEEPASARRRVRARRAPERYSPSKRSGFMLGITGPFGGSGKTTIAYYAAYAVAQAYAAAKIKRPVYLIEADYANPKLQGRLRLRDGQTLAHLVSKMQQGAVEPTEAFKRLEELTVRSEGGVNIIACPREFMDLPLELLREALMRAYQWTVEDQEAFVVLDLNTLGPSEGITGALVQQCHSIIMVTDAPNVELPQRKFSLFGRKSGNEAPKIGDRSHLEDAANLWLLMSSEKLNGYAIPENRLHLFFNRTPREVVDVIMENGDTGDKQVAGNLPYLPVIDKTWASNISRDRAASVEAHNCVLRAVAKAVPGDPAIVGAAARIK